MEVWAYVINFLKVESRMGSSIRSELVYDGSRSVYVNLLVAVDVSELE